MRARSLRPARSCTCALPTPRPHPPHCLARSAADKGEATEPKGDGNYFNANSPFIFPFNPSVASAGSARAPPAILFRALMFSKVQPEEKDHFEFIVVYLSCSLRLEFIHFHAYRLRTGFCSTAKIYIKTSTLQFHLNDHKSYFHTCPLYFLTNDGIKTGHVVKLTAKTAIYRQLSIIN